MRVKFDGGILPDGAPSEMKSLDWMLTTKNGDEVLRIKFYGKNYQTGKYTDYFTAFAPCEPNYRALANGEQRIVFASGASSVRPAVMISGEADRRAFWLKARKNKTVSVTSIGCAISFFYPDKKLYEEAAAIDILTLENILQTGDYLFVISPAGTTGKCLTEFNINY